MDRSLSSNPSPLQTPLTSVKIGCVSFLNAKPLIEGIESVAARMPSAISTQVRLDVPSQLLDRLERREVQVALCPVIDLQISEQRLAIVPVGGIGCAGTTLTVRLFSRVPFPEIHQVHADTDSHTSVILMQTLLARRFGVRPEVIPYHAREHVAGHQLVDPAAAEGPEAMLLIGDKVVTDPPCLGVYPYQLDLGELWRSVTGLPFVFAVWTAHEGAELGILPRVLDETRQRNEKRIDVLASRHAANHGWPVGLAQQYLGGWLQFGIGPQQLEAISTFHLMAYQEGLLSRLRSVDTL